MMKMMILRMKMVKEGKVSYWFLSLAYEIDLVIYH